MATSKNNQLSLLARSTDSAGDLTAGALTAEVLLQSGALDSDAVINLIDSDYVSARAGGGGGGASTGTAIAMSLIFG